MSNFKESNNRSEHDILCVWHANEGYYSHVEACEKCEVIKQARKAERVWVLKELENIVLSSNLCSENYYDCSERMQEILRKMMNETWKGD